MTQSVFFSFQYKPDNWRVQQVMNMGAITGESAFTPQDWEAVRRSTDKAIKNWIDKQMAYTKAVIVLVGSTTYESKWVKYEICKAWNENKPLLGVRIHGLADQYHKTSNPGRNPFEYISYKSGQTLDQYVKLINPTGGNSKAVYQDINQNLEIWVKNYARRRS